MYIILFYRAEFLYLKLHGLVTVLAAQYLNFLNLFMHQSVDYCILITTYAYDCLSIHLISKFQRLVIS